ncbi:glycoside hydrolase family 128 protein [Zopfia rhizophila CBS 207.26]|uniref:Glycoside hydrolase family 128 protein n=1 Tax=Zopfia rhizophila CBS 207.26 TaxID=1314779 RepID=A0A6A6DMY3_9PEZI|nr:glycoside hydrolase family 128 protein [Zopfia rhizophila CBS 207.26]
MVKSILSLTLLGLVALSGAAPLTAAPITEDVPATIQARAGKNKRGIAFNDAKLTKLFKTQGSKVSWMYNWDSAANGVAEGWEFVPLLHGKGPEYVNKWTGNVEKAIKAGATHAMSFNEPDQCGGGGACMQDVGATVAAFKQWVQPLSKYGDKLKIGAPAVTNGVKDSVTGSDMGLPWLKRFLAGCSGCKIDFTVIHWYDSAKNVPYFKKQVTDAYNAGGKKPVWITEFAPQGSDQEKIAFLREVLPWLDSQDWVERYAYHFATPGILVNAAGNALTPLGQAFNTI